MTVILRSERADDAHAIHALIEAAFAAVPESEGTEARIVAGLRGDGDLALSLVAVEGGEIVGHVAFSPVTLGGARGDWLGLAPLSVHPDRQRRGIGGALVREGLAILEARGAAGCVVVGDPAYYHRFGFRGGALSCADIPARYVLARPFGATRPAGPVTFRPAFSR